LYLLMVFEESLANRSDRMALYHALVKWAFTEKRLGKEDWISYKDTLDDDEYEEDEFNLDYIGAKPDKFIDELRAICNSRKEE